MFLGRLTNNLIGTQGVSAEIEISILNMSESLWYTHTHINPACVALAPPKGRQLGSNPIAGAPPAHLLETLAPPMNITVVIYDISHINH